MTSIPPIVPPTLINKYFFRRHGVPATVTTYTEGANDAYGVPTLTANSVSINEVILSFSRRSLRSEDAVQGSQFIIEAEVYLLDEDFERLTGISAPLEPDAKRPLVTIGNAQYDVFETENPEEIGIVRFICRKKRVG